MNQQLKLFFHAILISFAELMSSSKWEVLVSNILETFNAYIINARTKHLISMFMNSESSLMQRIVMKLRKKSGLKQSQYALGF